MVDNHCKISSCFVERKETVLKWFNFLIGATDEFFVLFLSLD